MKADIHALGDAPSPRIIGLVSDHSSLGTGLGVTLVSLLLATLLLFLGARNLEAPSSDSSNLELPDSGAQALPVQA